MNTRIVIILFCFYFLGGVREALFGDEYYPVMWGNRNGFAKVAIQANVVRSESVSVLLNGNWHYNFQVHQRFSGKDGLQSSFEHNRFTQELLSALLCCKLFVFPNSKFLLLPFIYPVLNY